MSRKDRQLRQAIQISQDPNKPIRQAAGGAKPKPSTPKATLFGTYRCGDRRVQASTNLGELLNKAVSANPLAQDWLDKVSK